MKDKSKKVKNFGERDKVVRATFSLPKDCVENIDTLQIRYAKKGVILNRSELVRLGLAVLEKLPDKNFQSALVSMVRMAAGRPRNN